MFKNDSNHLISLPILISVILLPCFLIYFLNSEFNRAKKSMTTEVREKTFESILISFDDFNSNVTDSSSQNFYIDTLDAKSNIENILENKIHTFIESVSLISDDSTNNISFNESDSKTEIQVTIDATKHINSDTFIFNEAVNSKDQNSYNSITIKGDHPNHFNADSSNMTIYSLVNKSDDSFLEMANIELDFISVFKRIIPQTILSLILLASVWLSFFLSARNLKKERQLTTLRNDFMSNMTHEIKTPVSTISVALEALKNFNAADNKELTKEYIDISKSEIDRLSLLVDKALNLSLYEQGKFVYEKQTINLDEEINRILQTLKVQLRAQNVSIKYNKIGQIFLVKADKIHLTNVIHNLIENGIKYSSKNPDISINLGESKDNIHITVSDKGIGIPAEYQTKVFEKFFRVPKGNTHNTKGHGLGLSYVKEVIESHNGTIELTSQVEHGTSFLITLPKLTKNE